MPTTVIRRASELKDGDEIVLRTPFADAETDDIALVQEKVVQEDGSVTLLVNVPHDAGLVTKPRPLEIEDPFDTTEPTS